MIDSFSLEKVRFQLCLLYLHIKKMARKLFNISDGISARLFVLEKCSCGSISVFTTLFGSFKSQMNNSLNSLPVVVCLISFRIIFQFDYGF